MEENKVCGLCGENVPEESLYNVVTYHGKKITLCKDCNKAVSSALSATSADEKAAAKKQLESLIREKQASPNGVLFVKDVVFEEKVEEDGVSEEETEEENGSAFATFLKVLAWIVWIGGLIIASIGSNITKMGYYSSYTEFSFGTFLTLLIPYLIYGVMLMGLATVVDKITDTNNKVNKLLRIQKSKNQ